MRFEDLGKPAKEKHCLTITLKYELDTNRKRQLSSTSVAPNNIPNGE